jgi:hypothetical protein
VHSFYYSYHLTCDVVVDHFVLNDPVVVDDDVFDHFRFRLIHSSGISVFVSVVHDLIDTLSILDLRRIELFYDNWIHFRDSFVVMQPTQLEDIEAVG